MSSTAIVAYLALFAGLGGLFLFVNLLVGKFLRPHDPHAEKLEVYECGEPTIGSSFVQFDLRFYVVALLFIIFDVEVAFFFPWATVFGKSTHLMDANLANPDRLVQVASGEKVVREGNRITTTTTSRQQLNPAYAAIFAELGVPVSALPPTQFGTSKVTTVTDLQGNPLPGSEEPNEGATAEVGLSADQAAPRSVAEMQGDARQMALTSIWDILVFFAVLMVGFAYVWSRGDLDWVRAVSLERSRETASPKGIVEPEGEPVLSA